MAIPEISRILMGYKKALDKSRARYENMYRERAKNTRLFYDKFLKNLIIALLFFQLQLIQVLKE